MQIKIYKLLPLLSIFLLVSCNEKQEEKESYPAYYLTDKLDGELNIPDIKNYSKSTISDEIHTYRNFKDDNASKAYEIISKIINSSTIYDMEGMNGFWYKNIRYTYSDNSYFEVAIDDTMRFTTTITPSYVIYVKGTSTLNKGNYYNCFFRDGKLYNELLDYYSVSLKVAGEKITDYSL